MNRLILIGNGFDLAHGLDTRYSDFMLDLIKTELKNGYNSHRSESDFFVVECHGRFGKSSEFDSFLASLKTLSEVFNNNHINHNLNKPFGLDRSSLFKFIVKSTFVHRLLKNNDIPFWVNIESEYFSYLKEIGTKNIIKSISCVDEMSDLNNDLKLLSNNLKEYLQRVNDKFDFKSTKETNDQFVSKIIELLFSKIIYSSGTIDSKYKAYIINYNYTSVVSNYITSNPNDYKIDLINLHGKLEDDDLIFGYGHVAGDEYANLEKLRISEALKSLKLFNYHMKGEYKKLTNLLQKDPYEVYILGHSCGESDGTTLRRIFDNPQCRQINICHISPDEYQSKTMEIKRHCLSEDVHDKIQSFNPNLSFPKLKKD